MKRSVIIAMVLMLLCGVAHAQYALPYPDISQLVTANSSNPNGNLFGVLGPYPARSVAIQYDATDASGTAVAGSLGTMFSNLTDVNGNAWTLTGPNPVTGLSAGIHILTGRDNDGASRALWSFLNAQFQQRCGPGTSSSVYPTDWTPDATQATNAITINVGVSPLNCVQPTQTPLATAIGYTPTPTPTPTLSPPTPTLSPTATPTATPTGATATPTQTPVPTQTPTPTPAPPAFVQDVVTGNIVDSGHGILGTINVTNVGDTICAMIISANAFGNSVAEPTTPVIDNNGGTYTQVLAPTNCSPNYACSAAWCAPNHASGSTEIGVTLAPTSGGGQQSLMDMMEFTNMPTSLILDAAGTTIQSSGATLPAAPTVTTTQANDVCIAWTGGYSGVTSLNYGPSNGYTEGTNYQTNGFPIFPAWAIIGSPGGVSTVWGVSSLYSPIYASSQFCLKQ